jgi:hypothetical protein
MPNKTFTQFREDNVVTTLPTTLAYGQEVYYKDANGNLTLWVGHEDGTAWPSCGYKQYVALFDAGTPVNLRVLLNTTGHTLSVVETGEVVRLNLPIGITWNLNKTTFFISNGSNSGYPDGMFVGTNNNSSNTFGSETEGVTMSFLAIGSPAGDPFGIYPLQSSNNILHIRIYP